MPLWLNLAWIAVRIESGHMLHSRTAVCACCTSFEPSRQTPRTGLSLPLSAQPGARMAEGPEFRATMDFVYGVPRELAPGVVRIVANNPSHFTFKGTNTYIVGSRELALIDPGPEDPAHLQAILDTIGRRRLSHVLITHTHRDHTDGLPALLAATGAKTVGYRTQGAGARHQRHEPLRQRVRRPGLHSRRPARRRRAPRGRRLGIHRAAHARACSRPSVPRAGRHPDAFLRRPRHGLEHQRDRAARRQHGRLHARAGSC